MRWRGSWRWLDGGEQIRVDEDLGAGGLGCGSAAGEGDAATVEVGAAGEDVPGNGVGVAGGDRLVGVALHPGEPEPGQQLVGGGVRQGEGWWVRVPCLGV